MKEENIPIDFSRSNSFQPNPFRPSQEFNPSANSQSHPENSDGGSPSAVLQSLQVDHFSCLRILTGRPVQQSYNPYR